MNPHRAHCITLTSNIPERVANCSRMNSNISIVGIAYAATIPLVTARFFLSTWREYSTLGRNAITTIVIRTGMNRMFFYLITTCIRIKPFWNVKSFGFVIIEWGIVIDVVHIIAPYRKSHWCSLSLCLRSTSPTFLLCYSWTKDRNSGCCSWPSCSG